MRPATWFCNMYNCCFEAFKNQDRKTDWKLLRHQWQLSFASETKIDAVKCQSLSECRKCASIVLRYIWAAQSIFWFFCKGNWCVIFVIYGGTEHRIGNQWICIKFCLVDSSFLCRPDANKVACGICSDSGFFHNVYLVHTAHRLQFSFL